LSGGWKRIEFIKNKKVIVGVAALLVILGIWGLYEVLTGNADKGVIRGSGFVEGDRILISAETPGRVVELAVDNGDPVKKGDLLVKLDDRQVRTKVEQAEAQLAAAESQAEQAQLAVVLTDRQYTGTVTQTDAALKTAQANLDQIRVGLEQAKDELNRYRQLYENDAISEVEFKAFTYRYEASEAQYRAAESQVRQAESALQSAYDTKVHLGEQEGAERYSPADIALNTALANKQFAEAVLAEAEAVLAKTEIYAPGDGSVVNTLVEEGEAAAPETPLLQLVNMDQLTLKVYVSGKDIGRIKLGQNARVYVDSFPDTVFSAKVVNIAQEAEFTPKNVHMQDERIKMVYAVELKVESSDGMIKPGMPADAEIITEPEVSQENNY